MHDGMLVIDCLVWVDTEASAVGIIYQHLLEYLSDYEFDALVVAPCSRCDGSVDAANRTVAELQRAAEGRVRALARLVPSDAAIAAGVAAMLDARAITGVILDPVTDAYCIADGTASNAVATSTPEATPIVVVSGWPFVSEALQVAEFSTHVAPRPVIMTNGGQLNISGLGQTDAHQALQARPNLLIQTTGVYRDDFLQQCVSQYGTERVIYASGSPLFDPLLELARVTQSEFSRDTQVALLGVNAQRVFNLNPPTRGSGGAREGW